MKGLKAYFLLWVAGPWDVSVFPKIGSLDLVSVDWLPVSA